MSQGPYKIEPYGEPYPMFFTIVGPSITERVMYADGDDGEILDDVAALNAAYAAGLAVSGREAEIRGMEWAKAIAQQWSLVLCERRDDSLSSRATTPALTLARQAQTATDIAAAIQAEIDKALTKEE